MSSDVTAHYTASADIAGRILAALAREHGAGAPVTVATLAPIDHFHARGLAATEELARLLDAQSGDHVLDIGAGIGGPARWLAATFGCRVTGIDLTPEFCTAARRLVEATGLAGKVTILEGDATHLPFDDATFDRAWSQNVIMNIADKARFYAEAFRVLRPGGVLALANVVAGTGGAMIYPVPWASTAAESFLATVDETRRDIAAAGFEIVAFEDTSAARRAAARANRQKLETAGLPRLGVHVFLGERYRDFQINSARNTETGAIGSIEVLARKPA